MTKKKVDKKKKHSWNGSGHLNQDIIKAAAHTRSDPDILVLNHIHQSI